MWPLCVPCASRKTQINTLPLKKNSNFSKHTRALKRPDMQTIHFIVGSKTQRTTPKDWELFDNVYNRPQKAAEVHQMLRQDGARRSPPRQNEVRYEIKFLEAQSYKGGGQQRF